MRVHLQALGCRLNEAELESWARQFHERGFRIAASGESADLIVVNTCAVTSEAVRKSRKLLRRTQRENPRAKLVVSGCFASMESESLARDAGIDLVVQNIDKDRLVEIATRDLGIDQMPLIAMDADTNPLFARGRQRAFVKVQDGCRYRCTFCVVTLARGEERSRPLAQIVDDVNRLVSEGVQEVVLTGVHLGGYESDAQAGLGELIRTVLADSDVPRLRLGSLEPWDLPQDIWELFRNERFMPHLHLPMQSGSDSVLRRMARRCKTVDFARLAEEARGDVPDLNITTDIIVGFPGETEAEWEETIEFVESVGFGRLHIFAYSPRAGTRAATLPNQVSAELKRTRSRQLHDLGRRLERGVLERFVNRRVPVLVEGRYRAERDGDWFGYTPNYLPVRIERIPEGDPVNRIVHVHLNAVHEDGMSLAVRS
ncbi:MAG: tRNA (N(6)-L-threonylcarbamoyladenosine(37)-C(2))-methylthiotransferase MtaB [Chromatiaceae bacterium]